MDLTDPKKIIIVQIGKIGDMILTTPLFSGIKKLFPESKVTVLSGRINKDIPLNHPSVDEVLIYKKNLTSDIFLINSSLRKADLWIDTKDNYSRTSELLMKIFKPKKSMGFNFEKKVFDISLNEYRRGNHAVDINLSPLYYFNGSNDWKYIKPEFTIPAEIQSRIGSDIQSDASFKNVLINVSAGDKSRYIQNDKWVGFINMIKDSGKYCFYLTGLTKDIDKINFILSNSKELIIKYVRTSNILETAELIKRCDYIISADTSIVHICSVFNKPVVAVYPDVKWNLEKFMPLSDKKQIVISGKENSIEDVKADEIVNAFNRLITGGNAESRTRVRKEDH